MDASNLFFIGLAVAAVLALLIGAYYNLDKLNHGEPTATLAMVLGIVLILYTCVCALIFIDNTENTQQRDLEREVQECVAMGGTPELDGYELDECVGA
jgi:type VI protein secretion system component VasK